MNEADSGKLAAGFQKLGWQPVASPEEATVAVVNTCVIRRKAENKATSYLGRLRQLKEKRDEPLQIAVMGCLVGPSTTTLRNSYPFVDVWAQPQAFEVILRTLVPEEDLGGEFWPQTFPDSTGPTAFVPVIHGCNKFCQHVLPIHIPGARADDR